MKSRMKDKTEGTILQMKGEIKEINGKLGDNPRLKAEGTSEKTAGKVQENIG
jgi:uncharacterized protein YjbJ (UPF0337 family)